jgi:DNA processing protein
MDKEKIFQFALHLLPRIGFKIWKDLITHFKSATEVYANPEKLKNISAYNNLYDLIVDTRFVEEAEKILLDHEQKNIQVISFYDKEYPERLRQIYNPPCFLYKSGNLDLNNLKFIAIVGTRNPSDYGKTIVKNIIEELKAYNVVLVSGMAYGIDILAHKYSLNNKIKNLGVIAGGIDKIYPQYHIPVYKQIISDGGAVITESPLNTTPENYLFPERNRIIAGCSDAVLIIEAGHKSGAKITAKYANDFNRDVFAVPGNIFVETSTGCNELIKNNQAQLVTSFEDIANVINLEKIDNKEGNNEKIDKYENLTHEEKIIVEIIKNNPNMSADEIFYKMNIDNNCKLSAILLNLELNGILELLPGDRYKVI